MTDKLLFRIKCLESQVENRYLTIKALSVELRGREWQLMKELPDGDYLFYNKNWKLRTTQTGQMFKGVLLFVGSYMARDIDAPTHYAIFPQPPKGE
jgi:hypothetical protein